VKRTLLLCLALSAAACGAKRMERIQRAQIQERLGLLEKPGLVIGEFPLESVLDGDTVRVGGLSTSLRLNGIDTEETFKTDGDRRLFETGWENYLKTKRGDKKHPVKMATPLGEEAKLFAKRFFEGSKKVRLERDDPYELRDMFGRYLAYVFAEREGRWVNYNVECVRAGMSPYFSKYGYSRRFHDEFVQAEKEAREAKLGIWSPDGKHYPDYDERKEWWDSRAEFLRQVDEEYKDRKDFIVLAHWDAMWRLEKFEGREATILGLLAETRLGDRGPSRAVLSRQRGSNFNLIFFDKDVFSTSQIANYRGDFITATGTITRYRRKDGSGSELQMQIKLPGQIKGRKVPGQKPLFPDDEEDAKEEAK
jgi:endonuclease YncB( thermonuclease family)